MDAATKLLLLQREYGGAPPFSEAELLIPASQALTFLRRLAELDLSLLSGVELFERLPDQTLLVQGLHSFSGDRTLGLTEAATFAQTHQGPHTAMVFTYDVFDDLPVSERSALLQEKPSLGARIFAEGEVEVRGVLGSQAMSDLVWHHVQLFQVSVEGGATLELPRDLGRYEQLEQATAWIRARLAETPEARFGLKGVLLPSSSPLPKDQWLLPLALRR
ncbi:hypothetical protein E7T06_20915 [Deinococcus sp. Arct2-2]|uniref:hypothetical protein n=1 Tax=Deinococcus sp. Arct2-2 TaxID=2568653 RepID=UPI0010A440D1|nr:hypothetical protein [Deinococcus sp. Arct2-2]THF66698.1 hypothetical protein E7T06_20915 [Deinococcus sp. Arct2-2]